MMKDAEVARVLAQNQVVAQPQLLDVGCGDGFLLDRTASSFNSRGFGVDVSHQSMLRGLRTSAAVFRPARSDARRLPFGQETFDIVVCMDVLEHIEGMDQALREMIRVLRPGGRLVCYAVGSKNRYTLNWFITKAMEAFGYDHWSRAGHSPELLVDPEEVRSSLNLDEIDRFEILPFHSFATIAYDQALLLAYWLATRLGLIGDKPPSVAQRSAQMLRRLTRIVELTKPMLSAMDKPWSSRGLSNGFLIVAQKLGRLDPIAAEIRSISEPAQIAS